MKLSELVDAEIINDHVNIHVKNLEIEGQLESNVMGLISDPRSTRIFRVIDCFKTDSNNIIRVKLLDDSLYIALSRVEYKIVERLFMSLKS